LLCGWKKQHNKTMSNSANQSSSPLPAYITSATPNPAANRAPWYKNTAPTYAGIFLWFVFWQDAANSPGKAGALSQGIGMALLGILAAGLICHFLFYLVPGLFGQRTGLPLYIVGTSTFGAEGGFLMPGFLMGLLQFGWLGVNVYFSSMLLAETLPIPANILMVIWGVLAAFIGLKGIQYVAKIATYLPLIPIAVLLVLLAKTAGGIGSFNPQEMGDAQYQVVAAGVNTASPDGPLSALGVVFLMLTYIVGFFATAGAAGVDFGTNSRDARDVKNGGLFGIALAVLLTAGISSLIVAGVHGSPDYHKQAIDNAKAAVTKAVAQAEQTADAAAKDTVMEETAKKEAANGLYRTTALMGVVLGDKMAKILMFLLAIAAFPPACFSSFIAANSFKTTLPKVNPFISVGLGAAFSIALAISGQAGNAIGVFGIIGASFGPICGAMAVDFLLSGGTWTGPRAGFNPAGWISWAAGFVVGIAPQVPQLSTILPVPAAPVAAFVVGAVLYFICAKIGLQSKVVPLNPPAQPAPAGN
jgi:cytosine permease